MAPFNSGPAPSLVIVSGAGGQQRIPIPIPDTGIVLGRDDHLGPPFSTDQFVSREHVSVYRCDDGSAQIADLGSANGTYVNGAQVRSPTRMRAGDVLRIGEIELKLDPGQAFEETIAGGPGAPGRVTDVPCLVILAPAAHSGLRFPLARDYMSVGREPGCDIRLDDPHLSRTHAALRQRANAYYVQDLGSSGGTFVNGVRASAARELRPGDVLTFASVQARFEAAGPAGAAEAVATVGAAHYQVEEQRGEIINNVGRDQHNSYVQHVIQQRENFFREIAATRTKARWLIWIGLVLTMAGFGLFAAGILGFIKQVSNIDPTTVQPNGNLPTPFGGSIHGVPTGIIGWAMGAVGMFMIIIGIVLHIVTTARRKQIDRKFPVPPPLAPARQGG